MKKQTRLVTTKSLSLKTQTVRPLTAEQLETAVGGVSATCSGNQAYC